MTYCKKTVALPASYSSSLCKLERRHILIGQGCVGGFRVRSLRSKLLAASALFLAASPIYAQQQPVTLTFEGVPDYQPVGSFYGPNFIFSPNTLALVDTDDGGGGNFANEPSSGTIIFFTAGSSAYLNVINGSKQASAFFIAQLPRLV